MLGGAIKRTLRRGKHIARIPVTVDPTDADKKIARAIARRTNSKAEDAAGLLTWGADEHILCALAAGWWLLSRGKSAERRRDSDHVLLTTIVVTVAPHLLKTLFNQERPDRTTVRGHLNGVPFSGKRLDAFPSGHAIHVGALASAATRLPPQQRNIVWGIGAGLVLTRIVLLAHWTTDVLAGLVMGAGTERLLRFVTGYGHPPSGFAWARKIKASRNATGGPALADRAQISAQEPRQPPW
jgi:PAP2 superfamily